MLGSSTPDAMEEKTVSEKNLSAEETCKEEGTRVPEEEVKPGREKSAPTQAHEGKKENHPLRAPETLKTPDDFARVFEEGKCYSNRLVALYVLPSQDDRLRLGICSSKKVGPPAARNRVKRRLREIVRRFASRMKRGRDLALVGKEASRRERFRNLEEMTTSLLRRAGILQD